MTRRADNDALIDAARGMAQAAAKTAAVFVEHGLPSDFLEQLKRATSALSESLGSRIESQRRKTVALQSVAQLVKQGTNAVQMLDAIIEPRLSAQPELLAAWRSIKRPIEPGGSTTPVPITPAQPVVKVA